jgi:hypothetical protein
MKNIIVKNKEGKILSSDKEIPWEGDFYKIYVSDEKFNSVNSNCQNSKVYSGKTGLIRTENYLFESKISELINNYNLNYESFKKNINIPEESEFAFAFIYSNESSVETARKEIPSEVHVEIFPVKYVDKNANIEMGYVKVSAW